jgi:hypothetical protein
MALRLDHLPPSVAEKLRRFHRRKQAMALLRTVSASLMVYALLALAASHLDRFFFLETSTRVLMFWAVHGAWGAFTALYLLTWLLRASSVRRVAYELEGRLHGAAQERYVTLDDVLARGGYEDDPVARDLVAQLRDATVAHSAGVRAARLVRDRKALAFTAGVVVVLAAAGALLVPADYQFGLMMARFWQPWRGDLPKPSFIRIDVRPKHIVAGVGEQALVEADISGRLPPVLGWLLRRLGMTTERCIIATQPVAAGAFRYDRADKMPMARVRRDKFLYSRPDLQRSFRYRVRCGDAQTMVFSARVVPQPKILGLKLVVTPPDYVRRPPQVVADPRRPQRFLPGSKLDLSFWTDQAVARREILFGEDAEPAEPNWDPSTRTGTYAFVLRKKVQLEIRVVNAEGFANVDRTRLTIDLKEDQPPTVRLRYPTEDLRRVAEEIFPLRAAVEDDYGIEELAMVFVVNPDRPTDRVRREIAIDLAEQTDQAQPAALDVAAMFDLAKTRAVPGDVVMVQLRARDTQAKDGLSREIYVQIVPFTRGENERKRLAALGVLGEALSVLAETPRPPNAARARTAFDIPPQRFEEFAEQAAQRGIVLGEAASVRTLLDFLEREQHFTDAPRHKTDARMLYGVLRAAAAPCGDRADDPYAARAETARRLARDLLPDLTRYRRLKNILWRLFGMRYEAADIRRTYAELAAAPRTDAGLLRSAEKRAELYAQTLRKLGTELEGLAERSDALAAGPVGTLVGAVNAVAGRLRTGSLPRRQAACDEVAGHLRRLLETVRQALPALFEAEAAARRRLADLYRRCRREAATPPEEASRYEAWTDHAAAWLDDDGRLMKWNPYLPFWPRFVNLALSEDLHALAVAAPPGARREAAADLRRHAQAMLDPPPEPARAVAREAAAATALAFDWQIAHVHGIQRIGQTEKAFETALLAVEEGRRLGRLSAAQAADAFGTALRMDLTEDDADAAPPRPWRADRDVAELRQIEEAVKRYAMATFRFRSPRQMLDNLIPVLGAAERQIQETARSVMGGDAPAKRLADLARVLRQENRRVRMVLDNLALQLGYLPPLPDVEADEAMFAKMRSAFVQYASRTGRAVALLETVGPKASPAEMAELTAELGTVKFLHTKALLERFEEFLRQRQEGEEDEAEASETQPARPRREYTILKEFAATRRFLEATERLLDGNEPVACARAFVEEFAEAGRIYLAERVGLIDDALAALEAADAALRASPPAAGAYDEAVAAALNHLEAMNQVILQSGSGETPTALSGTTMKLVGRVSRLPLGDEDPPAAAVNERRFDLEALRRDVASLAAEIRSAARQTAEDVAGLDGGPASAQRRAELAHPTAVARRRLIDQYRHARRVLFAGVLEALADRPDPARYHAAHAAAGFLHHLVRSALYGPGSVIVEPPRIGAPESLLKWLKAERENAVLVKGIKDYTRAIAEYLESMKSELRR